MSIKDELLGGLNFFQIIFWGANTSAITLCTYRTKESVETLYNEMQSPNVDSCEIWEFNSTDLDDDDNGDSSEWFPIFFVELRTEYNDTDSLVEDLMVWRLSGMMDKEMEGV